MPDGFDPHVELDSIFTLREITMDCRRSAQDVSAMYRFHLERLRNDPGASIGEVVLLGETILSRAYGKPRQQLTLNVDDTGNGSTVKFYMPHNNAPEGYRVERKTT